MRLLISLLTTSILLVSCGGDKGSSYSPLNSEQKQNYNSTLESLGRSFKAGQTAKSMRGVLANEALDPMQHKMAERIVQKNCALKFDTSGAGTSSKNKSGDIDLTMDIAINGALCPVEMKFYVGLLSKVYSKNHTDVSIVARGNYSVIDEEYKQWNDIYGLNFDGGGKVVADYEPSENKAKQVSDVMIKGELLSKKHGKGSFEVSNRGEVRVENTVGKGEIVHVFTINFADYNAELKQTFNFEGAKKESEVKTSYYLNGESITALEFNAYISKAAGGTIKKSVFSVFSVFSRPSF